MTNEIGEKIKAIIDFHREEAIEHNRIADGIKRAWEEWDEESLFLFGVLTEEEVRFIREMKSRK